MAEKLIIVIDPTKVPTDKLIWMADSVYTVDTELEKFTIQKHRFIEAKVKGWFNLHELIGMILTNSYRKI